MSSHGELQLNNIEYSGLSDIEEGQIDLIHYDVDKPKEYEEKSWGGDEALGFSYSGKRSSFVQAQIKIKELLKPNIEYSFENSVFSLTSMRKIPYGQEYLIEVNSGLVKGSSIIKFFGPNTKKEYKIAINKSKSNDVECVRVLSENIVKPLLDECLSGKGWNNLQSTRLESKDENANKCKKCYKLFSSEKYLMVHNNEMHKIYRCDKCDKAFISDHNLSNHVIRYHDLKGKEHVVEQLMDKSESEAKRICNICGEKITNQSSLNRHKRDKHEIHNVLFSPPTKKRKRDSALSDIEEEGENMETEMVLNTMEKMEINLEVVEGEPAIQKSIMDKMDEKVRGKQSRQEKEFNEFFTKLKNQRKGKCNKEKEPMRYLKKVKKARQSKSEQRKVNKLPIWLKQIPSRCKHLVNKDSYLFSVPGNGNCGPNCCAAHLFGDSRMGTELRKRMNTHIIEYHEYYKDKGYWCDSDSPFVREVGGGKDPVNFKDPKDLFNFLASEESSHMYSDSEDFLVLANMFNMHINIIRDEKTPRKDEIKPDNEMKNSAVVKSKSPDMTVLYIDSNHFGLVISANSELAKYGNLKTSSEITSSWTSSKIYLGSEDEWENIDDMKYKYEEEMISDLQKKLKDALNTKDIVERDHKESMTELINMKEQLEKLKIENKALRCYKDLNEKKNLSQSKAKYSCPQCGITYLNPEDLNTHTKIHKGNVVFKCETCYLSFSSNKDLSDHVVSHGNECQPETIDLTASQRLLLPDVGFLMELENCENEEQEKMEVEVNELNLCKECSEKFETGNELKDHMLSEHRRINKVQNEWNCYECCFQGSDKKELKNHMTKHTKNESIQCRNCSENFENKWLLMNHRRDIHPTNKLCRYDLQDNCNFSPEQCWYKHKNSPLPENATFKCFSCHEIFNSRILLMKHRKKMHIGLCRPCENFLKGECKWDNMSCWYSHETKEVFQKGSPKSVPPLNI